MMMSWVTIIWSMAAAACLTLAAVHGFIWWKERAARLSLLFAVTATLVAVFGLFEFSLMRAQSTSEYTALHRWAHVAAGLLIIALVSFVRLYFGTGRAWLYWLVIGLRGLVLVLNFLSPASFNFREITTLRQFDFLGESVVVPIGVPTPYARIGEGSVLLVVFFVADAAISLWRRGNARERRRAVFVGGTVLVCMALATANALLIHTGLVPVPYCVSLTFVLLTLAMAYELGQDVLHAGQLAQDLRESEQRVDLAATAANLGLWSWNLVTENIWATQKARDMFGLNESERLGYDRFLQCLHPDDREGVTHAVARAMNGDGDFEAEYRVVVPGRAAIWVEGRGRIEFDAQRKPVLLRGVSIDITERKRAEERFRLAVEASPSAIIIVNHEGKIQLANALTEKLFGYDRDELMGQLVEVLIPERFRGVHPGHRAGFVAAPQVRPMGAGRELFARRKDGTEFPVEIGLNPFQTEQGVLVLSTIVDITERRRAEAETQDLRRELAHSGRVNLLGQLASALAHELSQPLGAILRNAEAAELMLQHSAPDLEELRAIITDIHHDNQRARSENDPLRTLLKRRALDPRPADLASLIAEVVSLVRVDAAARRVAVECFAPHRLPGVLGDRVHLQQVLLNLILNAMDAVNESANRERSVRITARLAEAGRVEVAVSDTGPGIPPESLGRLFEPFFTTKTNGLGMGLPLSKTIIEAHQGRIWAENRAEGGACFKFTVPVVSANWREAGDK